MACMSMPACSWPWATPPLPCAPRRAARQPRALHTATLRFLPIAGSLVRMNGVAREPRRRPRRGTDRPTLGARGGHPLVRRRAGTAAHDHGHERDPSTRSLERVSFREAVWEFHGRHVVRPLCCQWCSRRRAPGQRKLIRAVSTRPQSRRSGRRPATLKFDTVLGAADARQLQIKDGRRYGWAKIELARSI